MKDLTIGDNTQIHLLKHLSTTEQLLAETATLVSGSQQTAQIYLMPDLGLPLNIGRIHGGFFTGALYSWTTTVPFVPIDTTVNSCGVSVFKVSREFSSKEEFYQHIKMAIEKTQHSSYNWNFASGNHFITYCESDVSKTSTPERYLVLHSSASEFKKQYNGLYPERGNWYSDKIKTVRTNSRYLRYIEGVTAEQFIKLAKLLHEFNQIRHRFMADTIIHSTNIEDEVVNLQHYGMPSSNSVAIGCQWLRSPTTYLLLTAPDRPMYLVQTQEGNENKVILDGQEYWLSPHGLGIRSSKELSIKYRKNTLIVNDREYTLSSKLEWGSSAEVRTFEISRRIPDIVEKVLKKCPGKITGLLNPIYTYDRRTQLPLSS